MPKYLNNNLLINKNNIIGRKLQDMVDRSNYETISIPNFGLGNFIKYIYHTKEFNPLEQFEGDNLEEIFMKLDFDNWVLDFQVLDKYVEFLKKFGVKNILIPVASREKTNVFNFFVKSQTTNKAYQIGTTQRFVDEYGNITKDGISIIEYISPLLRDQLAVHATNNSSIYEGINFYYSFDEFSKDVNNRVIKVFENISVSCKNFWMSHLYGGWEFKIKSEDFEGLKDSLDPYDYITLQQREFVYNFSRTAEKQQQLIDYFDDRNNNGKKTHIYSSWNNYPASYLNSNGFEMQWAMLFSNKIGASGYDRYQIDGYKNDISLDQSVKNNIKEPGDSFYIYPGDGENMLDSLRYLNMIKGINLVNKLNIIIKDDPDFKRKEDILVFNIDNEIRYLDEKWNLDYYNTNRIYEINSISAQSTYLNWLITNYGFN